MDEQQRENGELLEACYKCGYLIVCEVGVRCSECGWKYADEDMRVMSNRLELGMNAKSQTVKAIWGWLGVWVAYSFLCALWAGGASGGGIDFEQGMISLILLGGMIWGSLGLGWISCRLTQPHYRLVYWHNWLRLLPWLHFPWLCVIAFGGFGILLSFLWDKLLNGNWDGLESLLILYGSIWLLVWVVGAFVMVGVWASKLKRWMLRFGVEKYHLLFYTAGAAWIGACLVGVIGGFFAAGVIAFMDW